jgi:sec-independent protein translocase protein TatB
MLNVGPLELLVVLAVALIVVGPERLPELARSVGRALRQLRQVQDEVRDMVSSGVDDEMRQAATEFKKATGDVVRAAGVGDLTRKSGRAVGPRKRAPTTGTAASETPEPSPTPTGESPATPTHEPEPAASTVDTEVAGPPADRLLEDGSGPTEEPSSTAGAPEGSAGER